MITSPRPGHDLPGHADHALEDHDRGLVFDLATLDRRQMLKLLGFGGLGAGLFSLAACAPAGPTLVGSSGASATSVGASAAAAVGANCAIVPQETAGPFPGDGSNGPNMLTQSGVVRRDIRPSFGTSSTVAEGVPLAIELTILDGSGECAPLAGAAVYLWHCDRAGNYSLYSAAAADENYLRGVQEADANGLVTFNSIFPACYQGRWPHIHYEVYPSLKLATDEANRIATSQIALPKDVCQTVYATDGYGQSVSNLSQVSLATDMVFRDGADQEVGTVSGTVADRLTVALTAPVRTA